MIDVRPSRLSALLYYDHFLTFPQEVERIWKAKWTFVNVLFLVNRYLTFLGYIPIVFFLFDSPMSNQVS